jgi:integrase
VKTSRKPHHVKGLKLRVPGSSAGGENDVQLQLLHQDAIPTTDQVDALLEAAWADNARNGFILEMTARSGLRWSEIMALKASDFDFTARTVYVQRARRVRHDGTVHVKMPKTKAGRRKTVLAKGLSG